MSALRIHTVILSVWLINPLGVLLVRWQLDRVPVLVLGAYITTVVVCFGLMLAASRAPDPFEQQATPVFGPDAEVEPESRPPDAGFSLLQRLRLPTSIYRSLLTYGLPGYVNGHHGIEPAWGTMLDEVLYILTDVRLSQPFSYLRSSYPMLSLVTPPGPGTVPQYVVHLPSDEPQEITDDEPKSAEKDDEDQLWLGLDEPAVIIYHTHTQESYWDSVRRATGEDEPREPFIQDDEHNVLRVGEEMANELNQRYGIATIHVRDYFDTLPDGRGMNRVGAYARSGERITALQKEYPSAQILLDVHRDATPREITAFQDTESGDTGARIMMVVGSDRHLDHPHHHLNLQFAEGLSEIMEEEFPGLFLRIMQKDYRYNQHLSPAALLLEVGGVENTMDEALKSARMMAKVLAVALKRDLVPDAVQ